MKKLNCHYILITGLLLFLCNIALAQTTPDSSNIAKLADRLSVSIEKAQQIQSAYNYRMDTISKLRADQTISAREKQRRLKALLAERIQKLNAVISPAQRMQLYQSDTAQVARVQAQAAIIKQRHQEQIDRLPHTQTSTLPSSVKQ